MKGETYLKKPTDFARVYEQGQYLNSRLLAIKSLPNGLEYARWGVIAGKKVGKAVIRNRIKRRLREILRETKLEPGRDIVVITRSGSVAADYSELKQAVLLLLKKGGLAEKDETTSSAAN